MPLTSPSTESPCPSGAEPVRYDPPHAHNQDRSPTTTTRQSRSATPVPTAGDRSKASPNTASPGARATDWPMRGVEGVEVSTACAGICATKTTCDAAGTLANSVSYEAAAPRVRTRGCSTRRAALHTTGSAQRSEVKSPVDEIGGVVPCMAGTARRCVRHPSRRAESEGRRSRRRADVATEHRNR